MVKNLLQMRDRTLVGSISHTVNETVFALNVDATSRVNLSHPNATTTLRDRHRVLFQTSYDIHFSIVLSFHLMSSLLGLLGLDVPTGHRGGGPTLLLRSIAARAPFRLRRAPQSEQTMNTSRKRIAFIACALRRP
jgi:hypothetical protein